MQPAVPRLRTGEGSSDWFAGPLCPWGELVQGAHGRGERAVHFQHRDVAAGAGAPDAALTGGPGGDASQLAAQGLDLADAAAFAMAVLIEAEQALFLDERFQRALKIG